MNPISSGALAIGNKLVLSAKTFRRGLVSSLDFGKQSINRTAEKINSNQKRIVTERKRQRELDRKIEETKDRKEKEKLIESKKVGTPIVRVIKSGLDKPLRGLWKLIQAWVIANLPRIIKEVQIFTMKVRIFGSAVKKAITSAGSIFVSLGRIAKAVLKNLSEFDFSDKSGRIKAAKQELDNNMDEIHTNFDEAVNVWNREEKDLEIILDQLESGSTMQEAVAAIENTAGVDLEPQNPAVGQQPQSVGPGNTATNTEWRPILELIARAESVNGSYDSIYPNSIKPGLSQMTIGQADAWQASTARQRGSAAAGRYQFMNIRSQAELAGLGPDDLFSPENQDRMAIALIEKKRKVSLDMLRNDPTQAALKLSQEWAGLPVLEQTRGNTRTVNRGQSYYAGDGRNKATVSPDQLTGAFASTLNSNQNAPQQPQAPSGAFLTDQLFAKDFDTKDSRVPSPIIRTSDRGMRWGRMHNGVDFGTGGQRGWYCALLLDGKVTYVGSDAAGGNMVFITSGGVEYCFMHLAKYGAGIRQGATYKAGQPIGEVGNTGKGTGIHLHFETRRPGTGPSGSFNPDPYVKYITFGKLKTRNVASASNTSGTSEARATEVATAAQSNRTGGTQVRTRTTVLSQKEIVMVG